MRKEESNYPYESKEQETEAVINFLQSVEADPEIVYAYEKTGILVTVTNRPYMSEDELKEWNNAIAEYYNPQ